MPQDYAEAIKWLKLAAEQGQAYAQFGLGTMYDSGHGVPKDRSEAAKWYRRAADQGQVSAQFNLGFYLYGMVFDLGIDNGYDKSKVTERLEEAYKWFNLAAAQHDQKARKYRDEAASQMTPDQIAEAQRMAREWKPKLGR